MKNFVRKPMWALFLSPLLLVLFVSSAEAKSAPWVGRDLTGRPCIPLPPKMGPYDYQDYAALKKPIQLVEDYHFTPRVRRLEGGQSGDLAGDLNYTISSVPNHHQVLYSLIQLEFKHALLGRQYQGTPIVCYLQRAANFSPTDGVVQMLYGIYLERKGLLDDAMEHYKIALRLMPKSAELHNNVGLLHLKLGDLEAARDHARSAYRLGYPLPGLRMKLQKLGISLD